MLPVQKPKKTYNSLEEIRERKDQLLEEINGDNNEFGTKWHSLFSPNKSGSKMEFVSGIVANSITAIDALILVRKLVKNYGGILGIGKKKKR